MRTSSCPRASAAETRRHDGNICSETAQLYLNRQKPGQVDLCDCFGHRFVLHAASLRLHLVNFIWLSHQVESVIVLQQGVFCRWDRTAWSWCVFFTHVHLRVAEKVCVCVDVLSSWLSWCWWKDCVCKTLDSTNVALSRTCKTGNWLENWRKWWFSVSLQRSQ